MSFPDINLDITESSTSQATIGTLGSVVNVGGKRYAAVYNAGADAIAAADVVGVYVTTPANGHCSVTAATMVDITDGTTTRSLCAGIGIGAIAAASYGWLQVGGFCASMTTDGNVAAGHPLVLADGVKVASPASTAASAHLGVFGYALAADSSTSLTASVLTGCAWGA